MIRITSSIAIEEREIQEEFIRSSGPGGQHVNKVATAVKLCFDVARSPSLSEEVRARLIRLAGSRVTDNGVIVIDARRFRSQELNRRDARDRLAALIRRAAEMPAPRRKTHPPAASKTRRLEEKHRRAETKRVRRSPSIAGDE
jgi:ribosome-associated protein